MTDRDVLIVGAGPSGVASALALKDVAVRSLVLDRGEQVAAAWRGRYDRLRLNTARPLSHLPGRRFAKGTSIFTTRDELIAHIESHAAENGLDFRFGTRVEKIARRKGGWVAHTQRGDLTAPEVIVAGYQNAPVMGDWRRRDGFRGKLLHSAEYPGYVPRPGGLGHWGKQDRRAVKAIASELRASR